MTAVLAAVLSASLLAGCGLIPAKSDNKENAGRAVQSEQDGSENLSGGEAGEPQAGTEGPETPAEGDAGENAADLPAPGDRANGSPDADAPKAPAESSVNVESDGEAAKAAVNSESGERTAETAVNVESGEEKAEEEAEVVCGDERADQYLPLLEGKRVAVFSNQTGIVGNKVLNSEPNSEKKGSADAAAVREEGLIPFGLNADGTPVEYGEHILDVLVRQGVDVTVAFSPEHGFRGTEDAGAQVDSYTDEKTGVPVVSLYGGGSMYPSDADLDRFDTLVIDIQDVGLRFYTYYISMYYLMDACAEAGKEVVLLDRPNPNGFYVDGPILQDGFYSGVGLLPIPVVHGMTLGELAQMINGEGWLSAGKDACSLTVVPCENYRHDTLTALVTRPSPNLKDMRAIYLYPSTCLFENTACSVGRGTEHPFEIFGSPWLEGAEGYDFTFTPEDMEGAHSPAFEGQTCYGKDLREIPLARILEEHIHLNYIIDTYHAMQAQGAGGSFFGSPDGAGHCWIDYLCGTDQVRLMIEEGRSAEEISASWQEDVENFKAQRKPYLLYEE